MNGRAMSKGAITNLWINVTTTKEADIPKGKPVLVWETRQKREERTSDNLVPLRRPGREGNEREATTMEWTVGSDKDAQGEEASTSITMVSSGFGETVQAPTAAQTSTSTTKMCLAA